MVCLVKLLIKLMIIFMYKYYGESFFLLCNNKSILCMLFINKWIYCLMNYGLIIFWFVFIFRKWRFMLISMWKKDGKLVKEYKILKMK